MSPASARRVWIWDAAAVSGELFPSFFWLVEVYFCQDNGSRNRVSRIALCRSRSRANAISVSTVKLSWRYSCLTLVLRTMPDNCRYVLARKARVRREHYCRSEVDDINLGLEHFYGDFNVVHARLISSGVRKATSFSRIQCRQFFSRRSRITRV